MFRGFPAKSLVISLFTAGVLLAGCAGDKEVEEYVERPVETLYNEATAALKDEDYRQAASLFDEVERQHPYSQWATRAQLMSAYSLYMDNRYDEAVLAIERFIQLHPSNKDADYAYYLKAISYYEQITDVTRDQGNTQEAQQALEDVVTRFPNSKYAKDARIKLDLTRDHLAGKEMEIGRFELRRKNYLAAINRFKRVLDLYQTTTHVPEALLRMTEAYMALGLEAEARKTAAVLGHNFPGSEWYMDAYELVEGKSVPRTIDGVSETADKPWYKIW